MGAFCDYLEMSLLNATLRNTPYTSPTVVYLALYTSDPTETGNAGTEVSGGSYVRQAIAFNAPANGATTNSADVNFPVATANQGTVSHWVIRDGLTGGNPLYYGSFTTPRTVNIDNQFIVKSGQLSIALD